ncbi:MAG: 50S ribosomal protein L25 [Hydrogenophilales bacterium CG17_big_fil_post_rev_8_21_14_2_50_63_12]|nr:MAG: 50S ribosomal protein L25 [Hydrogenophilales bacterium CG17_big_fil_post_rev_8_21_14_2_50_63_12]PIX97933.1 MAG: 50S ribosomal protein L25 [Hydrogenophilales bacterium CG_4_10_14_3_um_filter_63_21]PJB06679.1 MAG: 50S ribosomal protein L25 [Hydrogenophilales bacterium CG_4_9_14_3_um_filter_63_34]
MQIEINAVKRGTQGTGASRRLRRAGRVPGIVYGGGKEAQSVDFDHKELYFGLKNEAFHSTVLTLNLEGTKESVLLRDFQMHPYKQGVQHIDFLRVDATHKIHMKVPLHFINADIAPGVKQSGGVVSHLYTEVEVVCLPAVLPEFIEVDLCDLASGSSLHMSHLKLPNGVELAGLHGEDPSVVTILGTKVEEVEPEAAKEGEAPTPAA